jgi:hypothetical protein
MAEPARAWTTVHGLWRTFFPAATFLAIYVGIFSTLVGSEVITKAIVGLTKWVLPLVLQ